jgi:hypothetical protein
MCNHMNGKNWLRSIEGVSEQLPPREASMSDAMRLREGGQDASKMILLITHRSIGRDGAS